MSKQSKSQEFKAKARDLGVSLSAIAGGTALCAMVILTGNALYNELIIGKLLWQHIAETSKCTELCFASVKRDNAPTYLDNEARAHGYESYADAHEKYAFHKEQANKLEQEITKYRNNIWLSKITGVHHK